MDALLVSTAKNQISGSTRHQRRPHPTERRSSRSSWGISSTIREILRRTILDDSLPSEEQLLQSKRLPLELLIKQVTQGFLLLRIECCEFLGHAHRTQAECFRFLQLEDLQPAEISLLASIRCRCCH